MYSEEALGNSQSDQGYYKMSNQPFSLAPVRGQIEEEGKSSFTVPRSKPINIVGMRKSQSKSPTPPTPSSSISSGSGDSLPSLTFPPRLRTPHWSTAIIPKQTPVPINRGSDDMLRLGYLVTLYQRADELMSQLESVGSWWLLVNSQQANLERISILTQTMTFRAFSSLMSIRIDEKITRRQKNAIRNATIALFALVKVMKDARNYATLWESFPAMATFIRFFDGYIQDELKTRIRDMQTLITEQQLLTKKLSDSKPIDVPPSVAYLRGQVDLLTTQLKTKDEKIMAYTGALNDISAIVEERKCKMKLPRINKALTSVGISRQLKPIRSSFSATALSNPPQHVLSSAKTHR